MESPHDTVKDKEDGEPITGKTSKELSVSGTRKKVGLKGAFWKSGHQNKFECLIMRVLKSFPLYSIKL